MYNKDVLFLEIYSLNFNKTFENIEIVKYTMEVEFGTLPISQLVEKSLIKIDKYS
jgi:hypothetical protein